MKNFSDLRIVCLGGGIGTVQVLRGLRQYSKNITVVCSMADDGGSGGRLRRLYSVPPPGDLINCLAALSTTEPTLKELLTFRFAGNRWGKDDSLGGQKLGNLILVALTKITGDFNLALLELRRLFQSHGQILPATLENVSLWATTVEGKRVVGEQKIDLGQYPGKRQLTRIHLKPKKVTTPKEVKEAVKQADLILAGPGDLYTTVLPVMVVPTIKKEIKKSQAKKIFILNVANKPFETPHYKLSDYLQAIDKHCGPQIFDYLLANNNFRPKIPPQIKYHYVEINKPPTGIKVMSTDLVLESYPLYHDPQKLAQALLRLVKFSRKKKDA